MSYPLSLDFHEVGNKKKPAIRLLKIQDKKNYAFIMKELGGRWNSTLKPEGQGWVFKEESRKTLEQVIEKMKNGTLPMRKSTPHTKLHRDEIDSPPDVESDHDETVEKQQSPPIVSPPVKHVIEEREQEAVKEKQTMGDKLEALSTEKGGEVKNFDEPPSPIVNQVASPPVVEIPNKTRTEKHSGDKMVAKKDDRKDARKDTNRRDDRRERHLDERGMREKGRQKERREVSRSESDESESSQTDESSTESSSESEYERSRKKKYSPERKHRESRVVEKKREKDTRVSGQKPKHRDTTTTKDMERFKKLDTKVSKYKKKYAESSSDYSDETDDDSSDGYPDPYEKTPKSRLGNDDVYRKLMDKMKVLQEKLVKEQIKNRDSQRDKQRDKQRDRR